jgi:hypothetical protein
MTIDVVAFRRERVFQIRYSSCHEPVAEVAGRQATQIQGRHQVRDRLRLAQLRREHLTGELLPLPAEHALVVAARGFDPHWARADDDFARPGVAVAHHEGAAALVARRSVPPDVRRHLRFERLLEHPAGTLARQSVERRLCPRPLVSSLVLDDPPRPGKSGFGWFVPNPERFATFVSSR